MPTLTRSDTLLSEEGAPSWEGRQGHRSQRVRSNSEPTEERRQLRAGTLPGVYLFPYHTQDMNYP